MIESYFTHTVNIYRRSEKILTNAALPINSTFTTVYNQDVIFNVEVSNVPSTIRIVGSLNGITVQEDLAFTSNKVKMTAQSFDKLTKIESLLGTGSATASATTVMGQQVISEIIIYDTLKVRIESSRPGDLRLMTFGTQVSNSFVCFTTASEDTLDIGDIVVSSTGKRYRISDINLYYDTDTFHHQELLLQLIL